MKATSRWLNLLFNPPRSDSGRGFIFYTMESKTFVGKYTVKVPVSKTFLIPAANIISVSDNFGVVYYAICPDLLGIINTVDFAIKYTSETGGTIERTITVSPNEAKEYAQLDTVVKNVIPLSDSDKSSFKYIAIDFTSQNDCATPIEINSIEFKFNSNFDFESSDTFSGTIKSPSTNPIAYLHGVSGNLKSNAKAIGTSPLSIATGNGLKKNKIITYLGLTFGTRKQFNMIKRS